MSQCFSFSDRVSGLKFYLGILIQQTNQQMLVIVGHTLNEGGSEPWKYWEMALTAHRSCLRPEEIQSFISYPSYLLPRTQTQSRTLILTTAVLTSINTVSPCNQNSTTILWTPFSITWVRNFSSSIGCFLKANNTL